MTRLGWLGLIGVVLTIGALRLTAPVSMALLFAMFLVVLVYPTQCALRDRLPTPIADVLSMGIVLAVVVVFFGSVGFCLARLGQQLPTLLTEAESLLGQALGALGETGLPAPTTDTLLSDLGGEGARAAGALVRQSGRIVQTVALVTVFALLGQAEAPRMVSRLDRLPEDARDAARHIASSSATRLRHYMLVQTAMGIVTGAITGLVCWALGIDEAAVWGVLTFLLYYVPSVGHIASVFPPALMALAAGNPGTAALALAILGAVQLVMGNFVDPTLLGRQQRISVLLILLSVVFWGWVGGVVGALLGVPLTLVSLGVAEHFERTRWIAVVAGMHDDSSEPIRAA